MRRVTLIVVAAAGVAILAGWFLVVKVPSLFAPRRAPASPATTAPEAAVRKIRARVFFVAEDGMRLVGVDRDVPYGATPGDQAQGLVQVLLETPPPPLLAPLPSGTSLRGVYVTDAGEAYVDLSKEATTSHTGGSIDELFSIYAVVNTITANLPAIQRVQILVDGKEVDSLAGHIDLRQPLPRSDRWMLMPDVPTGPSPAPAGASPSPSPSPSPAAQSPAR